MAKKKADPPVQTDIEDLPQLRRYPKNIACAVTLEQHSWLTTRETEFGMVDASAVVRNLVDRAMRGTTSA